MESRGPQLPGLKNTFAPWGVTTDGCGSVFVCDQMFSTSGRHVGCVFDGSQGLGVPWRIRWCQTTSSLIVAHLKEKWYLTKLSLTKAA